MTKVLVVEEQIESCAEVILALTSFLPATDVRRVGPTAHARAVLEQLDAEDPAQWFVMCGLTARSWAPLVLLEWMRHHQRLTGIRTGLLTDTAPELLPVCLIDRRDVRLLPSTPSEAELRTWIENDESSAGRGAGSAQEAFFARSTISTGSLPAMTISSSRGSWGSTIT
jgi:hypothetical protein